MASSSIASTLKTVSFRISQARRRRARSRAIRPVSLSLDARARPYTHPRRARAQDKVQEVKRACEKEMDFPLMEEYDFKHDLVNASLPIDLRPTTKVRAYQEKSLAKVKGDGLCCPPRAARVGVTALARARARAADVWQRASAFGHHRAAVRRGQNAHRGDGGLDHSQGARSETARAAAPRDPAR